MKLLVTGDWHRDVTTGGFDRYEEVGLAIGATVESAQEEKCDGYLFLGDLTDPDSGAKTHRAIADTIGVAFALSNMSVESWWLTGNHDVIEDGHESHVLMALDRASEGSVDGGEFGCKPIHVVSRPMVFQWGDVAIVCLPYTSLVYRYDPAEYIRAIATSPLILGARHVIVAGHMTRIPGYADGSETLVMPRGRDMTFPVQEALALKLGATTLINGHYHQRNVEGSVLTPGALVQVDHGEEQQQPGWMIIDTEPT